jgi:branched-chain amino acid transport system substrate-binding protein
VTRRLLGGGLALILLGAGGQPAPAGAPPLVKIGDLGSKVGVLEGYGTHQTMGLRLAVEEINASGGVLGRRLELVSEDDESKPAVAARKAEKLIRHDGVTLLVGAVSSDATMAAMDVSRRLRTIHWNSVACAEFMRTTKFHKYYFSNQPDARMQANAVARHLIDTIGTRAYVVYTDYAMGQIGVSDGRQF